MPVAEQSGSAFQCLTARKLFELCEANQNPSDRLAFVTRYKTTGQSTWEALQLFELTNRSSSKPATHYSA